MHKSNIFCSFNCNWCRIFNDNNRHLRYFGLLGKLRANWISQPTALKCSVHNTGGRWPMINGDQGRQELHSINSPTMAKVTADIHTDCETLVTPLPSLPRAPALAETPSTPGPLPLKRAMSSLDGIGNEHFSSKGWQQFISQFLWVMSFGQKFGHSILSQSLCVPQWRPCTVAETPFSFPLIDCGMSYVAVYLIQVVFVVHFLTYRSPVSMEWHLVWPSSSYPKQEKQYTSEANAASKIKNVSLRVATNVRLYTSWQLFVL